MSVKTRHNYTYRGGTMEHKHPVFLLVLAVFLLSGCGGMGFMVGERAQAPTQAVPAKAVTACTDLNKAFSYAGTTLTSVTVVPADTLRIPGITDAMPEHCLVKGKMNERKSPVDGKTYAIGFEMRLPISWNGRFFYQGNGGTDGMVTNAYGDILGGGPTSNGLLKGFAVISSDAGHQMEQGPIGGGVFGIDPAGADRLWLQCSGTANAYGQEPYQSLLWEDAGQIVHRGHI